MKRLKIITLRELFAALTNHWTIFIFVLFFSEISSVSGSELLCWIILSLCPLILFISREIVQSFLLMLVTFVIYFCIISFFPMDSEFFRSFYQMTNIFYLCMSCLRFFRKKGSFTYPIHPVFPICANFLLATLALITRHSYVPFYSYLSVMISSLSYFLALYLDQFIHFASTNDETSSNMPEKKILSAGFSAAIKYLSLLILPLTMIVTTTISDDFFIRFFSKLHQLFRTIFRFFASFIVDRKEDIPSIDGTNSEHLENFFLPEARSSLLAQISEKIAFALAIFILFVFAIRLILKIYKWIYASFHKHSYIASEEEKIIDLREKIEIDKTHYEDDADHQNLSYAFRIRKLYKKKANNSTLSSSELYRMTAREFSETENSPQMAYVYEKARYSVIPCTKDDLKQMQDACRRKKKSDY